MPADHKKVADHTEGLVSELTVSNLVFKACGGEDVWLAGFAYHRRLGGYFPASGHVEHGESLWQAAFRETIEELGCESKVLPGPAWPTPPGYPHASDPAPFWTVRAAASPDNHTAARHMHHDAVFVSLFVADVGEPETEVVWLTEQQVREAENLTPDSRLQVLELFPWLRERHDLITQRP